MKYCKFSLSFVFFPIPVLDRATKPGTPRVPSDVPQTHTPTFTAGQASYDYVPLLLSHWYQYLLIFSFYMIMIHSGTESSFKGILVKMSIGN